MVIVSWYTFGNVQHSKYWEFNFETEFTSKSAEYVARMCKLSDCHITTPTSAFVVRNWSAYCVYTV